MIAVIILLVSSVLELFIAFVDAKYSMELGRYNLNICGLRCLTTGDNLVYSGEKWFIVE